MTIPTPPIARPAVPVLEQELAARKSADRLRDLLAPADELIELKAKRTREALLAEQRHQYLDLDPDSAATLPGCTCVACPPKNPGGTA